MSTEYTLQDLEAAKAELARWERLWDNYSGNNPNKYRSDIKAAQRKVRVIRESLRTHGLLEEGK